MAIISNELEKGTRESRFFACFMNIYAFLAIWHFFMSSTFSLRLTPVIFWPVLALVGFLILTLTRRRVIINDILASFVLCVFVMFLNSLISFTPGASLKFFSSFVIYLLVAVICCLYCTPRFLINSVYAMCIIHLVILLIQYSYGALYTQYFLPLLPAKYLKQIAVLTNAGSYNGFTIQTSMTACYMAIGGIISINMKAKERFTRVLNFAITILFVFGTFLTGRRGTSIILLLIMIYVVYKSNHGKSKFLFIILASFAIISIFGIENIPGLSKLASKFSTLNSNGDLSNGRYEIWNITFDLIKNKMLFGYGLDTYTSITGYASAHNSFLNSLFELGIMGTLFFYLPFVLILWKSISISRTVSYAKLPEHIKISLLFQFLFFGSAMFEGYFQSELSLLLLFIFQFMTVIFIMKSKESIIDAKSKI